MRIILWPRCALPNIGGVEVATHTLARQLTQQGHEVIVMASQLHSREFSEFELEGIRIYAMPLILALMNTDLVLIKKILDKVHSLINTFKPDMVHIHHLDEIMAFYQVRSLVKKSLPLLVTLHNDLTEQKNNKTPHCLQLLALASACSAVSNAVLKDYGDFYFASKPPITLIYNALKPNAMPLQAIPRNYHVVMVGRLSVEKGFDVGFKAIALLVNEYPRVRLTLVGNGPEYQNLQQLRHSLGLKSVIEMVGFVAPDQVYTYIDQASVVLMPSTYEPFGLVALETALRGRTLIASNIMGLKEVVVDHETGLLIEPNDPALLAAAIEYLFSHPSDNARMAKAAGQYALKTFDLTIHTTDYLQLYQSVMDKHYG